MIHNIHKKYKKYNIYKITNNKDDFLYLTFYISTIKQKYKDINNKSFSFIQYIVDIKNNDATLIVLKTNNIYKNKGYATKLLDDSINYLKNIKIKKIELDDMSDHSWEEHNIYISFGFEYINDFPEPEMILNFY